MSLPFAKAALPAFLNSIQEESFEGLMGQRDDTERRRSMLKVQDATRLGQA